MGLLRGQGLGFVFHGLFLLETKYYVAQAGLKVTMSSCALACTSRDDR